MGNLRLGSSSLDEKTKSFLKNKMLKPNRFESFEEAEALFKRTGFVIDKEAEVDFTSLSAFPYVVKNAKPED